MKEPYSAKLELFAENAQRVKKGFAWKNAQVNRLAALLYTAENKIADSDAIRASYELIKEHTGSFSTFRGTTAISIAALLSLSAEQERQLADTLAVYEMLKDVKFRASDYLVIAAYQIAVNTTPDQYQQTVERAKAFYDRMKSRHPFLTGRDDYIFAAMLGLSGINVESGVERMEQLYAVLKPEFLSGNSVQALTQVLVLGEDASETAAHVLALREAFRARGIRLDKEYTLSSLGVLSLLPCTQGEIVNDVSETYEFLRTQKGFGSWSITKQELLLLSAAMVAFKYVEEAKNGVVTTTLTTSITNIVIAQQTAIAAAAAASAASASSASS
ncbi:hypothetical protein A3844_08740 [Paenibacillus helianthi]|uniref:DUF4003 domain-containing protein n=1 Tax=Paenibacillus helianthi TaxID=1349432 RepID=A0ABX3EQM3_9BACL|nr:DUF4003 family protein [Paenibacillus helianthi]OKP88170.1 hypothetical protein A3844_08740 [Paenibacillus helianthi]